LLRRVVWQTFTNVPEVLAASIIRAIALKAATSTSEMSVTFYQTTRRNNSEDSHLQNETL
jgi:hypothetical protein